MTEPAMRDTRYAIRNPIWPMVAVLLVAAAFRFVSIGAAPPGWRDDELIEFDMDRRIVEGWRPLFIAEAEGHEPFYHYLHAGTIVLFGENIVGYKWLPFAFGCLSVALTFALARRLFDPRVALLAAALMAVSLWPIMYARFGLRHIGIVPLTLGTFWVLYPVFSTAESAKGAERNIKTGVWQQSHMAFGVQASACGGPSYSSLKAALRQFANVQIKRKFGALHVLGGRIHWGRMLIATLLLAAALMTYFAGRALPLILIGFLVYLLVFERALLRRVWLGTIGAIAVAALIAAPMFVEIARTPGAEKRTEVVGGPLMAALRGDLQPAIATTLGTLGMFTFAGDPESLYNVPNRPVFDWLTGAAFYLGVLLCLVRLKRIGGGFALVWLAVGIAPAFVSLPAASFSHTIAAQPVIYMLAAYGAVGAVSWLHDTVAGRHAAIGRLVTLSWVVLNAFLTTRDYFGTWANDPFVRFQYHAPTRDLARWLDQHPEVTSVAVGTHPNYLWLDPLALELDLAREDVKARWFNPERALIFLPEGKLILSPMQSPGSDVKRMLDLTSIRQQVLKPNSTAAFDVYDTFELNERALVPWATFDGVLGLVVSGLKRAPHPGEPATFGSNWVILQTYSSSPLKSFVHILDDQGQVVSGEDRLDVNLSTLLPGDVIYQYSHLSLPADLAPGRYPVEVGWYHAETGERLRLPDGSDRFLLDPIEVPTP